jgi:hypothetical protein
MSASGVFGPAPEGIDLSKTQNAPIRNAVVSLMVIGTVFVGLRLVARRMQKAASLGLDDFCIILGLVKPPRLPTIPVFCLPNHRYLHMAQQFAHLSVSSSTRGKGGLKI